MAQFRWIMMSSFLMLLVQFRAAAGGYFSFTVRVGDEVTLPGNVIDDQHKCNCTNWIFSASGNTVELCELGQIHEEAKAKSDRLSVTENCSLVIKKVTEEDAGRYTCRQVRSGEKQVDTVDLSLINPTEQRNNDTVTFNCSVSTFEQCRHVKVKWLYEGDKKDFKDMKTSPSTCSATVTFTTSGFYQTYYQLMKCEVIHKLTGNVQLFPFIPPQSSGEKSGWWWLLIIVFVGLVVIIPVGVFRWKRAKGNKTQTDDTTADPEAGGSYISVSFKNQNQNQKYFNNPKTNSRAQADPEDGVSYASISYTKKTSRRAQGRGEDDNDDAVTYSTVKVSSSSSAGASAHPINLDPTYAGRPKK
ncbi:uncharacterized protein LOC144533105 isoform X1 [Sander vitreus]